MKCPGLTLRRHISKVNFRKAGKFKNSNLISWFCGVLSVFFLVIVPIWRINLWFLSSASQGKHCVFWGSVVIDIVRSCGFLVGFNIVSRRFFSPFWKFVIPGFFNFGCVDLHYFWLSEHYISINCELKLIAKLKEMNDFFSTICFSSISGFPQRNNHSHWINFKNNPIISFYHFAIKLCREEVKGDECIIFENLFFINTNLVFRSEGVIYITKISKKWTSLLLPLPY